MRWFGMRLVVGMVATAVTAVLGLGALTVSASATVQTVQTVQKPAPKPLALGRLSVECECGGAGYLWGWRGVWVPFKGARAGYHYRVAVKGGPKVDTQVYGSRGAGFVLAQDAGFEYGATYRFRVEELRGKRGGKVARTTGWQPFTIPTPVAHPDRIHLDSTTLDGEEVLVAGQTYHLTFDGQWGPDVQFASGVDRYRGLEGDDRFGWYEDEDYPLPWESRGSEPIVELTVPEEFAGTEWHIVVVGYRAAGDGSPVRGSEWGFELTIPVVSAADGAGAARRTVSIAR